MERPDQFHEVGDDVRDPARTAARDKARNARVESWLAKGGTVLAANERAARTLTAAFHAARLAEGRKAWPTPSIFTWDSWVRERWLQRDSKHQDASYSAGRMLLNPLQEQSIWSKVIAKSRVGEDLLHRSRLAASAQQAYKLLCGYAPTAFKLAARAGWSGDAAVFNEWLEAFESYCRREGLVSGSRLALECTEYLREHPVSSLFEAAERSQVRLVGFDRLLKTQEALLNAWGNWEMDSAAEVAKAAHFLSATDSAAELTACVNWIRGRLKTDPSARLMVVTTGLQQRRGELERAMLEVSASQAPGEPELRFEFSLGVALSGVSLARSAVLLLRWLHEPLSEPEVDWLLGCGHCVAGADEEMALATAMRRLRRRGKERPAWALEDFVGAAAGGYADARPETKTVALAAWSRRMLAARDKLRTMQRRRTPLEWVEAAAGLLEMAPWPGFRPLSSVSFQARERWESVLEQCGSLGFDESSAGMEWAEFVAIVADAVSGTIFAAESSDARVLITEPLESAGQLADGIWFLGANEENWPGRGQPHPLLPIGLQRESGMPHASPLADWQLAKEVTSRLLASADEVVFSFATQSKDAESRPSRIAMELVGPPQDLPEELQQVIARSNLTETFEDAGRTPFPHSEIGGGAATLTRQSLCAFQAFATARLHAEDWKPAEVGLNAKQRGQLLHDVMHRVWAGSEQGGVGSLAELHSKTDLREFVSCIVRKIMDEAFVPKHRASLPARFPDRYLQLESERLTRLVTEWLTYERERLPFTVEKVEARSEVIIAGLKFELRMDRVDLLENGSRLVIDYKSSEVGPKAWEGDRPDDVQLPLYASFAVREDLQGLAIARVRPGTTRFFGRVRNARNSLRADLTGHDPLVRDPLTDAQLSEWRERIERLGEDFVNGRADLDPKNAGQPCEKCHLHAVCRIYENQPLASIAQEDAGEDSDGGGSDGGDDD